MAKALTTYEITHLIAQHHADAQALADTLVHAAVTAPRADPEEIPDNATAAIITIGRTA